MKNPGFLETRVIYRCLLIIQKSKPENHEDGEGQKLSNFSGLI